MSNTPTNNDEETPQEQLVEKMTEIRIKELERKAEEQANVEGLPYVELIGFPIGPETISTLTEAEAEQAQTVCFFRSGSQIRLDTIDPSNPKMGELVRKLQDRHGAQVVVYLISNHSFKTAMKIYKSVVIPRKIKYGVDITEEDLQAARQEIQTIKELREKIHRVPVTELVATLIAGAINMRATDIHLEAEEKDIKIRYRIDGVLHEMVNLPKELWDKIDSRIKALAKLKLNITDIPQDGRFTIFLKEDKIDVRVSTLPIIEGESIALRLLMSSKIGLEFEKLGLRDRAYKILQKEIKRPNGMIITTGPTGSGKTTTLYAILNTLNDEETKIITLEDPIEYRLQGINQSQVDLDKGYTFGNGLKHILRQDPDIIMVGEIRDADTTDTTIQAALTGHLVVSTIHTNSAAAAIPRLLSMGAKPFLLTPALNAIIGQRLVRRICPKCVAEDQVPLERMEQIKKVLSEIPETEKKELDLNTLKFYKGQGCKSCNGIGYYGRVGIYEILTINEEIEKIILSGRVSEYSLQKIAVQNGMVTMAQDGLLKALDKITSVEEIFRVAVK